MFRIVHPVKLEGSLLRLEPLDVPHYPGLMLAANDARIWSNLPIDGSNPLVLKTELGNAMLHRAAGSQYPFTVIEKQTGQIVGSTRLMELFPVHNKLEIGWTWYNPTVWGKGHNLECKLLLLTYCFEILMVNRVQLKTRDNNTRSQNAIRKIGGVFEGILRSDRVMNDGTIRDTVLFSIVVDEWPEVKAALKDKLQKFL